MCIGEKVEIFRLFDEEGGRSVAHLVLDKISYGWAVDAFYSARFVSGSRTFSEERGDDSVDSGNLECTLRHQETVKTLTRAKARDPQK